MPCTRWDMEIALYFSSQEPGSRLALIPKPASLPLRENMCLILIWAVGERGRAAELDKRWAYKTCILFLQLQVGKMAKIFALTQRNSCMCALLRLRLLVFFCLKWSNKPILQKRKLDKQEKCGKILCPFQEPLKSSAVAEYQSCSFPSWMIPIILTAALWELTFPEACAVADSSNAPNCTELPIHIKISKYRVLSCIRILVTHFPMNPGSP